MSLGSWNNESGWTQWYNNNNTGDIRIDTGTLVLPFNPVPHQGIGEDSDEVQVRYRFGQKNSLDNQISSVSMPLRIPNSSSIELTDNGLYNSTRTGYADVASSGTVFNYPSTSQRAYISFWFKSNISNYSTKAYIVAYFSGIDAVSKTCAEYATGDGGDLSWAIVIDDNKIKAIVTENFHTPGSETNTCIAPVGGDVIIDTNWHHVMLFFGKVKSGVVGSLEALLVVDNNFGTEYSSISDSGPLGGANSFNIGSASFDTQYGFSGVIDEFVLGNWRGSSSGAGDTTATERFGLLDEDFISSYRFAPNIFLSPVIDTGVSDNTLSSMISKFDAPNGSSVQFSFRASNTSFEVRDSNVPWTGFTFPGQVASETNIDLGDMGLLIRGRYVQARIFMSPSDENSPQIDELSLETPAVYSLSISSSSNSTLLHASNHAYVPGTIIGQVVEFSGEKTIHKATLNLTLNNLNRKQYIEGKNGVISFQASNFQRSRSDWVFQPENHWLGGWQTSGTTISNSLQYDNFDDIEYAISNSPKLGYDLYFPDGGSYDLWGYGFVDGDGIFWSFNDDETHIRTLNLGIEQSGWYGIPRWTKFGTVFVEEGGVYHFDVYLKGRNTVILDQWYFTTNINLEYEFNTIGEGSFTTPLPLSACPYNTVVRLRSLTNSGDINPIDDPSLIGTSVSAWLPSTKMVDSGKYNYEIRNLFDTSGVSFENGLSIEYWQIGGNKNYFAAWDYAFPSSSIGNVFKSIDFGQTYDF